MFEYLSCINNKKWEDGLNIFPFEDIDFLVLAE